MEELLERGARPRRRVRRAPPRTGRRARRRRARGRHARAGRDLRPGRPRRVLRDAQLHARHHRPAARRPDPAGAASWERRSRRSCCSSSSSGTCCPTSAPRSCSAAGELAFCRHHLRSLRRYRPHQLTEPEERVMTELDVTGASAFRRLFTEQISSVEVTLPDARRAGVAGGGAEPAAAPRPRRVREQAARGDHRGAAPGPAHARVPVQHAAGRQGDEGPPARLPALARVAQPRQRGQRRVRRGADRGGRRAATSWPGAGTGSRRGCSASTGSPTGTAWRRSATARSRSPTTRRATIVLDCYSASRRSSARPRRASSSDGYIDAPPRPGKRGGAFCSYTVPSRHPYVMLNYTSRPYDVLALAHELGHGVHAALAQPAGHLPVHRPR